MGKVTGFLEFERRDRGYDKPELRRKSWREFVKPLPEAELGNQAARCMDCGVPFCHNGCPVNNLIPDWNNLVYRHQWIIIVSGAFEPIFYLLGLGLGLGALIDTVPLADGRSVPYAAFVAPALVATAAMNGAVFETIFNVFFKLNYAKTYDGVLATPIGINEIAIGEMLWALMRAALYAVAMFVMMSLK